MGKLNVYGTYKPQETKARCTCIFEAGKRIGPRCDLCASAGGQFKCAHCGALYGPKDERCPQLQCGALEAVKVK